MMTGRPHHPKHHHMASPSGLPSSPAARAFFAALDSSSTTADSVVKSSSSSSSKQQSTSRSHFIQKKIQTLGWRNRYSQDELYPIQVVGSSSSSSPSTTFHVMQVQRGEVEGTYGTGATVWPASIVMIKYLEHQKVLQQNHAAPPRRVVDLGAGTAVTSIAAALLGAKQVLCTDGESKVVQLARENIQRAAEQLKNNNQEEDGGSNSEHSQEPVSEGPDFVATIRGCPMYVQEYWWGSESITGEDGDIVLVSDCVLPKLYPIAPLVEALDQLLINESALAILSYEHRYYPEYDPRDKFRELSQKKGLEVTVVPMEEQDPVYSVEDIEIWRVQRRES